MIIFLIFLSFWLGLSIPSAYIALSLVAIVFLLFVYKRFSKSFSVICLSFISLGIGLNFLKISYPQTKTLFVGLVYTTSDNYFLLNSGGERLYVYAKNHSYDIGDILTIEGEKEELDFVTLESAFNFKSYLNKRGVYHSLKIKKVKVNFHNFIRIHERREKLLSMFDKESRSIVGAILFSDGDDSELSTSLRELHLARFLAASGIFISAFHFVLKYIFKLFLKDKYADIVSISLLVLYSVFTFPRFSVIKVMLLLIIRWINKYLLKNKFSYLTIIGSLGMFCLLMNHYLAKQDGFILGFLIPIIMYLCRYIGSNNKLKSKVFRYLIIYLFFLPFEVNYYNKIVILSLPLQIISTPLFMVIGVVSLLCFFYVPLYSVDKFLISILSGYASIIKPLGFGINMPTLNEGILLIYYSIYFVWLYYASHDFVPLRRWLLVSQISFLLLLAVPFEQIVSSEVNFISVGQGDCTLIRDKGKVTLIDTGGLTYTDIANNCLIPYLRKKKIYKIDTVFITHYDYDHFGALEGLAKEYKINHLYDYNSSFPIQVGNLTFNNYNYYGDGHSEENDKSLVLSFYICKKHFVVCGDAPKFVEKEIIKSVDNIPCDILRVGHHGSNTSTSEEWIKYLNPKEAVISVGKNNKYGHPDKEVLSVLKKYQIKIRRTDIEGTIKYWSIFN